MRLGELWAQLPPESRCVRSRDPDALWDEGTWVTWQLEFTARCLLWSLTNSKKNPIPKPEPLPTPGQKASAERRRDRALAAKEEIRAAFGMGGDE